MVSSAICEIFKRRHHHHDAKRLAQCGGSALENFFQVINKTINGLLEETIEELQQSYPFYFEKFRTDGVEYDIYVGQSIAPDKPFDMIYLKNLRLWQLNSMATM